MQKWVLVSLFLCAASAAYPQAAAEGALVTGSAGSASARGAASLQHTITNATQHVNAGIQGTTAANPATVPVQTATATATATPAAATIAPAEAPANPCAMPARKRAAKNGSKQFTIRGGHAKASSPPTKSTEDGVTIISERFTVNGSQHN